MNIDIFGKTLFLFLLAIIPSLVWLAYFLKRDKKPEPRRFLFLAFVVGGALAALASQAENNWFFSFVQNNSNIKVGSFLFFVFYPLVEEVFKFLAGRISTIKNKYFLDEKTDPMVYMITSALGFAAFENLKIFFSIVLEGSTESLFGLDSLDISQVMMITLISTAFLRFISTVLLHALSSGILGFFWGSIRLTNQKLKMTLISIPTGIILATCIHAIFNYLVAGLMSNFIFAIPLIITLLIAGQMVRKGFQRLSDY